MRVSFVDARTFPGQVADSQFEATPGDAYGRRPAVNRVRKVPTEATRERRTVQRQEGWL
jgi:hypothetical protein